MSNATLGQTRFFIKPTITEWRKKKYLVSRNAIVIVAPLEARLRNWIEAYAAQQTCSLAMDETVWVPTVFSKNRQRLIEHDAVVAFFNEVLETAENKDRVRSGSVWP